MDDITKELQRFPLCMGERPAHDGMEYLYPVPTEDDWHSDYGCLITVLPNGESFDTVLSPEEYQDVLHNW